MSDCGCNKTTSCEEQKCGCAFELDADCVRFTGSDLECLPIKKGDTLGTVIKNLDDSICNIENGSDGNYTVVTEEVAGANCTNGGQKVEVFDGETNELLSTSYVCNGVDGLDGLNGAGGSIYTEVLTGSGNYIVPAGVDKLIVEAWGGGAGSSFLAANVLATGSSGSYIKTILPVTGGQSIPYSVAIFGNIDQSGNPTTFDSITAGGGQKATLAGSVITRALGGVATGPAGSETITGSDGVVNFYTGTNITAQGASAPKGGAGGFHNGSGLGYTVGGPLAKVPGGGGGSHVSSTGRGDGTGAAGRIVLTYFV